MDSMYNQEVAKYGKKDAIIALCAYVAFVALMLLTWAAYGWVEETRIPMWLVGVLLSIPYVAIVFVIITVRKQRIASIGLHPKNLLPALWLGLLFGLIPLIFSGILPGVLNGWEANNIGRLLLALFYIFVMAVHEDIIFVGYLQTRLHGLIKNSKLAICAGATLFALGHIPVGLAAGGMDFLGVELLVYLAISFIMHCIMVALFRKYFSIATVTIFHMGVNFSGLYIWQTIDNGIQELWYSIAFLVLFVALGTWGLCSYFHRKKAAQ